MARGADLSLPLSWARWLAAPQMRRDLCALFARQALTEVRHGFEQQMDPTDTGWRSLKPATLLRRRTRKRPPASQSLRILIDRRRLMGSFVADVITPSGFRIRTGMNTSEPSVRYAYVHQFGSAARNIPKRSMVPDGAIMPARWEAAFRRVADEYLRGQFGEGVAAGGG